MQTYCLLTVSHSHVNKYNKDDIVTVLNYIRSRVTNDVSDLKFNWVDALLSKASAKQAVHDIGTRGGLLKNITGNYYIPVKLH